MGGLYGGRAVVGLVVVGGRYGGLVVVGGLYGGRLVGLKDKCESL